MHQRPATAMDLRHGGKYYTEAGIRRGPTQYHYALACALAWRAFPQVVLTAAFVRLRFISKPMAAHMLKCHEDEISEGLASIENWQQTIKKISQWLHADQDFSGTTIVDTAVPHAAAKSISTMQGNLTTMRQAINPSTLSGLAYEGTDVPDAIVRAALHRHRQRAGSALASLAALPSSDNVGEYCFFSIAISTILKRSMFWCNNKRFTPEVKEDVLEWQHDFLKKQYSQLVEKRSSQVMRMSNGIEVPVDINQFMWSCLKMLHRHTQIELDNVVRRMVGDVKKYGLNLGLPRLH